MLGSPLAACTGSPCSICAQALARAEEIKLMLLDELTFVSCSHVLLSLTVKNTEPVTGQMPWAPHCRVFLLRLPKVWYFKNILQT